jgi:hypothetical protein
MKTNELKTLALAQINLCNVLIASDPDPSNPAYDSRKLAEGVLNLIAEVSRISDRLADEILSTSGLLRDQKELAQQDEPPRADSSGWPYDH